MASNDSGVDTSNDSNDSAVAIVPSSPGISSAPPPPPPASPAPPPLLLLSLASQPFSQQPMNSLSGLDYENQHNLVGKICARIAKKKRNGQLYLDNTKERHLRLAASTGNIELLTKLLESGTNPNCPDEHERSPLHLAACRGYADIVSQLLKYGANPNIVDSLDNTPLHLAVISASSNSFNLVVKTLLQGGADVHALDRSGKNPLQLAENKLRLLKSRYSNQTPEMKKIVKDMYTLIFQLILHSFRGKLNDELVVLEECLQNLKMNNNDINDTSEIDNLFSKMEHLSII